MIRNLTRCVLAALLGLAALTQPCSAQTSETPEQRDARMDWWRQAKFGMFIHWGVYAVPAKGEWYMHDSRMPVAEYEKLTAQFNPVNFDAEQWASLARDAGMQYLVITAKHHDGFSMFKTGTTKYNIVDATPWGKDPLAALSQACAKNSIRFCAYYSIMDWHEQQPAKPDPAHPEYNPSVLPTPESRARYATYMKTQLREIIEQYHPSLLWFDGHWASGWNSADGRDLVAYLRGLNPNLIINDRTQGPGDYLTPEQTIPTSAKGKDWETCMTINNSWGYSAGDRQFKSAKQLTRNLVNIVSKGGNYLLNVGPTPDGVIPQGEIDALREMGRWLKTNGQAIYGAQASPLKGGLAWGGATQKPGKLFLHVFDWPADGQLFVPMTNTPRKASMLADPSVTITAQQTQSGLVLKLPPAAPDKTASVIVLDIDEPVNSFEWTMLRQQTNGDIRLTAQDCEVVGNAVVEGSGEQNVGAWFNPETYLQWTVHVDQPGTFNAKIDYALLADSASEVGVFVDAQSARASLPPTAGWSTYKSLDLGPLTVQKAGDVQFVVKAVTPPSHPVMNFRKVILTPVQPGR